MGGIYGTVQGFKEKGSRVVLGGNNTNILLNKTAIAESATIKERRVGTKLMAVLDMVKYGDPILRKKCKLVEDFSNIGTIVDDMFDSMYEAEVLDSRQTKLNQFKYIYNRYIHTEESDDSYVFVNNSIIESSSNKSSSSEGCLSLPNISLDINDPENKIKISNY